MQYGIEVFDGFSYDELLPMIREAGFDGYFLGFSISDDFQQMERVTRLGGRLGLRCENAHAPIPGAETLWDGAEDCAYLQTLFRCVDACAQLCVPSVVVHVETGASPDAERGMARLAALTDYAGKKGVAIAFENIRDDRLLAGVLSAIPDANAGFCYDIGHAYCYTEGRDILTPLSGRLVHLHISDNDGRHDQHLLPFDGVIPFAPMMRQLSRMRFDGSLTLELTYRPYQERMGKRAFIEKAHASLDRLKSMYGAAEGEA